MFVAIGSSDGVPVGAGGGVAEGAGIAGGSAVGSGIGVGVGGKGLDVGAPVEACAVAGLLTSADSSSVPQPMERMTKLKAMIERVFRRINEHTFGCWRGPNSGRSGAWRG